jgi:arylsulfatase A-like enzyme
VIEVPLIVRFPQGPRGRRVTELVQQIDLLPTLLDAVGIRAPGGLRGHSLLSILGEGEGVTGGGGARERVSAVLSKIDVDGHWVQSVTAGPWRFIRRRAESGEVEELFRLTDDPNETHNVAAEEPGIVARLRAQLDAADRDAPAQTPEAATLDPRLERELRALGYL